MENAKNQIQFAKEINNVAVYTVGDIITTLEGTLLWSIRVVPFDKMTLKEMKDFVSNINAIDLGYPAISIARSEKSVKIDPMLFGELSIVIDDGLMEYSSKERKFKMNKTKLIRAFLDAGWEVI